MQKICIYLTTFNSEINLAGISSFTEPSTEKSKFKIRRYNNEMYLASRKKLTVQDLTTLLLAVQEILCQ
jgi:hypothetical protein